MFIEMNIEYEAFYYLFIFIIFQLEILLLQILVPLSAEIIQFLIHNIL